MSNIATRLLAAGLLTLTTAVPPAGAEPIHSNGYTLDLALRQQRSLLRLDGRVEDGPFCPSLRLDVVAVDPAGTRKRMHLRIAETGGIYSRLVEAEIPVKLPVRAWTIERAEARCEGERRRD